MAYDIVATSYVQCKVMEVEQDIDVKKAQGGGTYRGTAITVKVDGVAETIKIAQKWLDASYQAELKAKIATLRPGQEITVVKVKKTGNIELSAYQALSKDEQKTMANWGVSEILDGHVAPQQKPRAAFGGNGGTSGQSYGKKDTTGMETGHALNGAMRFEGAKATLEVLVETAKGVHDITAALKAEYAKSNPDMSDYDAGAAVGHAVLNALEIASARKKPLADVPAIARKWLAEAVPAVKAHIKPAPAPKAEEPVTEEADEAPAVEDFDDSDIPF